MSDVLCLLRLMGTASGAARGRTARRWRPGRRRESARASWLGRRTVDDYGHARRRPCPLHDVIAGLKLADGREVGRDMQQVASVVLPVLEERETVPRESRIKVAAHDSPLAMRSAWASTASLCSLFSLITQSLSYPR